MEIGQPMMAKPMESTLDILMGRLDSEIKRSHEFRDKLGRSASSLQQFPDNINKVPGDPIKENPGRLPRLEKMIDDLAKINSDLGSISRHLEEVIGN
jgi:hypothetical protein